MKKVAKLVLINPDNKYLLMYRSDHPAYGNDPDLPGGTLEEGESLQEALLREVYEETKITVDAGLTHELYAGTNYSDHNTLYGLFVARLDTRPEVVMSWEHSFYEWIDRDELLEKAMNAQDTYMHMVYHELSKATSE